MSKTKYKVSHCLEWAISPVEVESETAYFITINGRRTSKESSWEWYYDDLAEAKAALAHKMIDRINDIKNNIMKLENEIEICESVILFKC